jgi:carbonic anhydrase
MHKLIAGVHQFQAEIFAARKRLFRRLEAGQHPEALFITCSDSRLLPNLLTQSKPGELFLLRNAGNIVPAYEEGIGGEAATIEYAVAVLKVSDIIVCGHSHCGAMTALLEPGGLTHLPAVSRWLRHAEPVRQHMREHYAHLSGDALLNVATQENVLIQIHALRTHPSVARALAENALNLHAWVYKFETGEVFAYSPEQGQFLPLGAADYAPAV